VALVVELCRGAVIQRLEGALKAVEVEVSPQALAGQALAGLPGAGIIMQICILVFHTPL